MIHRKAWEGVAGRRKPAKAPRKGVPVGQGASKAPKTPQRSKYGAVKTNGYASKKEAKRAGELRLLEKARRIECLRFQVPYELIPSQRIDGKVVERACSYVADFVYIVNAPERYQVVEDAKGFRTPDYIIKRKLMLHVHGIRVREV